MASSPKPNFGTKDVHYLSAERLSEILFSSFLCAKDSKLILAYSGGGDSQVLLHLLVELRQRWPIQIMAAHFDHGIHQDSAQWVLQCKQWCENLSVTFVSHRQVIKKKPGQNLEALARHARYQWLSSVAQANETVGHSAVILTAHHADDQAETFLHRLFKGKFIDALAGIRPQRPLYYDSNISLVRPLLDFERQQIMTYAHQHQLEFIDDTSNADLTYDRNYLRHRLLSYLKQRNPAITQQLCRAATRCRHISERENTIYADHIKQISLPGKITPFCLSAPLKLAGLLDLDDYSLQGLIRFFLYINKLKSISERSYNDLQTKLNNSSANAKLLQLEEASIRRYGDCVYLLKILPTISQYGSCDPVQIKNWHGLDDSPSSVLAGSGIQVSWVNNADQNQQGFDLDLLSCHCVQWGWRKGGERITLPHRLHSSSLKKQFNARGVAPWLRDRLPMLMIGSKIAWIYGVGMTNDGLAYTTKDSGWLPRLTYLMIES